MPCRDDQGPGRQDSGPFGRGGASRVAVDLDFTGKLGPAFTAFAMARARRLGLTGWIEGGSTHARAHAEGSEALVGAFEMACCVGPDQSLIYAWTVVRVASNMESIGFEDRSALRSETDWER